MVANRALDAARARARRRRNVENVLVILLVIGLLLLAVPLEGWIIMLLLGALNHSVSAAVPALGYGGSVIIVLALSTVGGIFRTLRGR